MGRLRTAEQAVASEGERRMMQQTFSESHEAATSPRAGILLVDDQSANLLALEAILDEPGRDFYKTRSGDEALHLLLKQDFAVILLDVQMQTLDGFETAKLIRGREKSRHTPIIFLTAYEDNRLSAKDAYTLGAVDYLVKPVEPIVLRSKVAGFIELFQKTEQVKRQAEQLRRRDRTEFDERLAAENARLRESEARKSAIVETALDAIITIDHQDRIIEFNPAAERMFGHNRSAVLGQAIADLLVPHRLRDQHNQGMAHFLATGVGPVLDKRLEMPALRSDGTEIQVELAISSISVGGPPLFTAYLRDITDRKRRDQQRATRLAITETLAEATSINEASPRLLLAIGDGLEWDFGAIWRADHEARLLRCLNAWHSTTAHVRKFEAITRERTFAPGIGLPGRVWSNRDSVWVPDVTKDGNFPRGPVAVQEELHAAFAFPIMVGQRFLGVMEFFSRHIREPDADLLELMTTIGGQVGQFIERKQAQQALEESEQRFSRFMQHLPGPAWIKDLHGRYVYANSTAEKVFRTPRADLYGKTDEEVFPADTAAQFRQNDEQSVLSGTGIQVVEALQDENGVCRYSLVSKFPILGSDGQLALVAGMAIDITEQRRMEQALSESEGRFRGLMEQAPFSVQIFSPGGRTLRVNRAWEQLWGVTLEQIADYNILEDQQLESKGVLPFIRRAFAGEPTRVPAIQYDPNETIANCSRNPYPSRWVAAVAYPLKDDAGTIREVVIVHDDITERKRAEEALQKSEGLYRAIGESIDYGVWVCDPLGRNIYASDSFLRLVGLTQQQCYEFGWGNVLHPEDTEHTIAAWKECVRTGRMWDIEHRFKGVDGQWHHVLARGVPVRNPRGEITAWAGINLDIRRIKQVEDELRAADRRKDEFLATLAHELRNPLAPIRNSLQVLKMPGIDAATAEQTKKIMERQLQHLVRLVDDLLDVSRVMRGKIELRKEYAELVTVVARAVEMSKPLIDAQGHRLDVSLPAQSFLVNVDSVRLAQVISNLLTNAAKYTEANGHIWLSADQQDGEVALRVRDNGIGIAPDVLPNVFELFFQADHTFTRTQGGLGIGLTLVRSLVEMHDGKVEAYSGGLGTGCEFVVRLPLLTNQHASIPHIRQEPSQDVGTGHPLLVVDDNQDAANSFALWLRLQGHRVVVAHDGQKALELASSSRPAMVFLDIGMPGMDGYEVARRIRSTPGIEDVVLVALTGWGQQEDRRRTAEAGFDHHLVKPPEPKALESVLAELKRPIG